MTQLKKGNLEKEDSKYEGAGFARTPTYTYPISTMVFFFSGLINYSAKLDNAYPIVKEIFDFGRLFCIAYRTPLKIG